MAKHIYSIDSCGPTICASSGGPGVKTGLYFINAQLEDQIYKVLQMFGFDKNYK